MELLVVSVLHSPVCPTLLCGGVFVKSCFPLQSWEINEDDSHIFLPSIPPFPPAPWQTQILAACSRHQKVYKPCLPGSGLCRTQMIQIMQMTAASRGRRSWTCWEGREISWEDLSQLMHFRCWGEIFLIFFLATQHLPVLLLLPSMFSAPRTQLLSSSSCPSCCFLPSPWKLLLALLLTADLIHSQTSPPGLLIPCHIQHSCTFCPSELGSSFLLWDIKSNSSLNFSSELWITDISLFYYNYAKIKQNYLRINWINPRLKLQMRNLVLVFVLL